MLKDKKLLAYHSKEDRIRIYVYWPTRFNDGVTKKWSWANERMIKLTKKFVGDQNKNILKLKWISR